MEFRHYSVMLGEVIEGLDIKPDGVYVDCTLGGAGHDHVILRRHPREQQSKDLVDMVVGSTRTTNIKRFCKLDKTFFLFILVLMEA